MRLLDIAALLNDNSYPGRGIIMGRSADAKHAVIAYFIMGRSAHSRNRYFIETEDGIRTEAYDPSLLKDPSLIIYHPVREFLGRTIVSNGDQTDTILSFLQEGRTFEAALRTRTFEPDEPNYTPRISGLVERDGSYKLSILKPDGGQANCCCRYYFEYDRPVAGTGHFIHTYRCDGSPLPAFEGEPRLIAIDAPSAEAFAELVWNSLDSKNKISLFVRYLNLESGLGNTVIYNINQQERRL